MPRLRPTRIEKITLPSYEDLPEAERAYVELQIPAHMTDFEDVNQDEPQIRQTASVIAKKIKSWNLTDEQDQPLPVNTDTVVALDAVDFATLSIALGLHKISQLSTQKKTS